MLATTAYFTRGLQLLLGSSKRAIIERAEEMGSEDDGIPLSQSSWSAVSPAASPINDIAADGLADTSGEGVSLPQPTQDPSHVRGTGGPPQSDFLTIARQSPPAPRQDPVPPTRAQKWAAVVNVKLDSLTYG